MVSKLAIWLYGSYLPLSTWEIAKFEKAIAGGQQVVHYTWPKVCRDTCTWIPYQIDFVAMTQTNSNTGTVKNLLRLTEGPVATSPYRLPKPTITNEEHGKP